MTTAHSYYKFFACCDHEKILENALKPFLHLEKCFSSIRPSRYLQH